MEIKNILLHAHIFKNAGSSFDDALGSFFASSFVDHRDDQDVIDGKMNYLIEYFNSHPKISAFSSHSMHLQPKNTAKYRFHTVHLLRHPIERIKSVYSFEKKQIPATTNGSKKAKELNFNDYVAWYMSDDAPATVRNVQTIFLSGEGPSPLNMDSKFKQAQACMKKSNLIGVVDRYDESMVIFEEYMKQFFSDIDLSYIRKNTTDKNIEISVEEKVSTLMDSLDEVVQKQVLDNNSLDMKLYEEANRQLNDKIDSIYDFKSKLDDFKSRCIIKVLKPIIEKDDYISITKELETSFSDGFGNLQICLILADAKKELKDYNGALNTYEETIKRFPFDPWAYFYKVEVLCTLGEKEESAKLFEKYSVKFRANKLLPLIEESIFYP